MAGFRYEEANGSSSSDFATRFGRAEPTRKVHLNVLLPENRDHPGWIRIEINGTPAAEFRVLGRGSLTINRKPASPHPSLSPFAYAGDTPTGDYLSPGIEPTDGKDQDSYGPWGAVRLKAISGDALLATRVFGRTGLLIHGGAPGRFDGYRSTLGCLRLHNRDMRSLVELISGASDNPDARRCEPVKVTITVRE